MNEIVRKNLEKMLGAKTGEMHKLLTGESMGGNAGHWMDKYPCQGANFYYDSETGEILYFGNCQSVPDEIKQNFANGIFRIAVNILERGQLIINTYTEKHIQHSQEAEQNLSESVQRYNDMKGFDPNTNQKI